MTRSRKISGKATAKENQRAILEVADLQKELIEAVQGDLARVNGLIFGMLKQFDLIKELDCQECGQHIIEPMLDILPTMDTCPKCEKPLDNKDHPTLDDWVTEEE